MGVKSLALNPNGGNVGIGMTSPADSLSVVRSAADSQYVANFNGSNSNNYGLKVNIANTSSNRTIADFQAG